MFYRDVLSLLVDGMVLSGVCGGPLVVVLPTHHLHVRLYFLSSEPKKHDHDIAHYLCSLEIGVVVRHQVSLVWSTRVYHLYILGDPLQQLGDPRSQDYIHGVVHDGTNYIQNQTPRKPLLHENILHGVEEQDVDEVGEGEAGGAERIKSAGRASNTGKSTTSRISIS